MGRTGFVRSGKTRKEKQLQEEIANLKKELENITAQRDLLVKVASRG